MQKQQSDSHECQLSEIFNSQASPDGPQASCEHFCSFASLPREDSLVGAFKPSEDGPVSPKKVGISASSLLSWREQGYSLIDPGPGPWERSKRIVGNSETILPKNHYPNLECSSLKTVDS